MGADGGCDYSGDAAGLRSIEDGGFKRGTGNIPEICKFACIPRLNRCCKSNETRASSFRDVLDLAAWRVDSSVGTPECRHIRLGKSGSRKMRCRLPVPHRWSCHLVVARLTFQIGLRWATRGDLVVHCIPV
jgi:hypothetical protein